MDLDTAYRNAVDRINLEYHVLLLLMLVSSVYMLQESTNFNIDAAATFPRLTAGFVLIGTVLLFIRNYLPDPLYSFVAESAELVDVDDEEMTDQQADEEVAERDDESDDRISTVGRPIHDTLFTALSAVGYGLLGYAIGILWASPIFVLIYGLWFKLSWRALLVLIPLSLLIGYGFMEALGVRIDRGAYVMTEGL